MWPIVSGNRAHLKSVQMLVWHSDESGIQVFRFWDPTIIFYLFINFNIELETQQCIVFSLCIEQLIFFEMSLTSNISIFQHFDTLFDFVSIDTKLIQDWNQLYLNSKLGYHWYSPFIFNSSLHRHNHNNNHNNNKAKKIQASLLPC